MKEEEGEGEEGGRDAKVLWRADKECRRKARALYNDLGKTSSSSSSSIELWLIMNDMIITH